MRFIRTDALRLPPDWERRAREARETLAALGERMRAAEPPEQNAILRELREAIARYAGLWGEIKDILAAISSRKCWYCESRENRSDMAVDHFRPKGAVRECPAHHGYWWLVFEASNYRYACTLCNSPHVNEEAAEALGKGTHFPLVDEGRRVFDPVGNLAEETPSLLDPTVGADPPLLSFLDDGSAAPAFAKDKSLLFYTRASTSIRVYNLNDVKIREERFFIAQEVKRQVERGEKYLDEAAAGDAAALDHFREVCRVVLTLIAPDAEYSAAARTILSAYRDKEWVVRALATA